MEHYREVTFTVSIQHYCDRHIETLGVVCRKRLWDVFSFCCDYRPERDGMRFGFVAILNQMADNNKRAYSSYAQFMDLDVETTVTLHSLRNVLMLWFHIYTICVAKPVKILAIYAYDT